MDVPSRTVLLLLGSSAFSNDFTTKTVVGLLETIIFIKKRLLNMRFSTLSIQLVNVCERIIQIMRTVQNLSSQYLLLMLATLFKVNFD